MNHPTFSERAALDKSSQSKFANMIFVGLMALIIFGCSDNEEAIIEDDVLTSNEKIVEADDTSIQEEVFLHGFRPGKLEVVFEFAQSGDFEEIVGDDVSKINWKSRIVAKLEQRVAVLQDLRKNVPVDRNASAEEIMEAFGDGAYIELDQYPDPSVSGEVSFENYSLFTRPGSSTGERLEEIYRGRGEIDHMDLSNFEISRYGTGYKFDLNIAGPIKTTLVRQSDQESSPRENVTETDEYIGKFEFHPKADREVFELFPQEEELDDLPPEIRAGNLEIQEQLFEYFSNLDRPNEEMLLNEFSPAITEASKDKLVVTYKHAGAQIAPPFASMNAIAAPPKVNKMKVIVTITAD